MESTLGEIDSGGRRRCRNRETVTASDAMSLGLIRCQRQGKNGIKWHKQRRLPKEPPLFMHVML